MRRWAALAVAALITPALSPDAQAAAPDPGQAIKRQLRDERGVRIAETSRFFFGKGSKTSGHRIKGVLRLAPSGPAAVALTWWDGEQKPYRVIRVGDATYDAADRYPGPVPDGKEWIRFPPKHRGLMARDMAVDASLQPIDVYDPAMMRAVLKRSTRAPVSGGFLYRGTFTYQQLVNASRRPLTSWASGRPIGKKTAGEVSWRLWTGKDGLLRRLVTADATGSGPLVKRSDTRYTGWGARPVIAAPPAGEVIDEADLLEYVHRQNVPIPADEKNF